MKSTFLFILITALAACEGGRSKNSITDSLGNKIVDSSNFGDTMSYERMRGKTGTMDTASQTDGRKNDTASYQRMPQRRDSAHKP